MLKTLAGLQRDGTLTSKGATYTVDYQILERAMHQTLLSEKTTPKTETITVSPQANGQKNEQLHDTFIQNVSHELRTPLALVLGYTELLHSHTFGELAPAQKEALAIIRDHSQQIQKIVDRVSILLSSQAGLAHHQPVQLKEIVSQVVASLKPQFEEKGVLLHTHILADHPPVIGLPTHLHHLVTSLVENALKFTPADEHVAIKLEQQQQQLLLTVADTGIGMDEATINAIRQKQQFFQADPSTTRRYGGLGLGLTLVNTVIHSHRAKLTIQSKINEGSHFTISFPLGTPENDRIDEQLPATVQPVPSRILVVDDEPDVAFILQRALQRLPNCEVVATHSGKDALKLYEQQPFDLLLTDYDMPGTDGVSLAEQIRERWPQTLTILITAHDNAEVRLLATSIAIDHLLNKQTKLSEMKQIVQQMLQNKERHRHDRSA